MKYKILCVIFIVVSSLVSHSEQTQTNASETPKRLKESELLKQFEDEYKRLCAAGQFSGAVLIAKNERILFERACGFANRERKMPNRIDTRFDLGSMNKMFTSVSVAQLVSQGRMKYSDTIADLLPDYPNKEAAKRITVEHLLRHSSGLADLFTDEFMRDRLKIHRLEDYLPYFANHPLHFEPGTDQSYSNAGFVVAGLIVQRVSGENYFDFVRKNVYEKAGMRDSYGFQDHKLLPRTAIGYTRERGKLEPNDFVLLTGSPAGGGYSTVHDLLKFSKALREGRLIPQEMLPKVLGLDRPQGSTYGYGFSRDEVLSDIVIGHAGGAEGINGDLDVYWKSGYTVVSLANLDPRAAEQITKWIKERILP